jgi:hypothetical protein
VIRWIRARWRYLAAVGIALMFVALSVIVVHGQTVQSDCQQAAYDALTAQLNQAGRITREDRQVVDDLITAIPKLTTQAAFDKALDAYIKARAANDAKRALLPPYPQLSDIC